MAILIDDILMALAVNFLTAVGTKKTSNCPRYS